MDTLQLAGVAPTHTRYGVSAASSCPVNYLGISQLNVENSGISHKITTKTQKTASEKWLFADKYIQVKFISLIFWLFQAKRFAVLRPHSLLLLFVPLHVRHQIRHGLLGHDPQANDP